MAEKLKQIPKQLLEFWNKYTTKQKTILISVVSIIIIAFAALIFITGRVEYEELTITDTPKEASEVVELLKSKGYKYELGSDKLTVSVDLKSYSDAVLLLASNDMPSTGITMDELLNNSLSTTNSDRNLKLNLYIQNQLRRYIKTMEGVQEAEVYYIPVDDSNSILTTQRETSASVLLRVDDDFEKDTAETIAEVVASVIGNSNSDNIRVADQNGNLLFGGAQDLYSANASSKEEYRDMLRNTFINNLYMGLIKSGYDDVVIMPNLSLDFKEVSELYKEYLPAEGQDQGVYSHSYKYTSENVGASGGGVPGTSANDETDYMIEDSSSSSGNVDIEEYDYLPNERVTNIKYEIGAIIPEQSSVSIIARVINTRTEEELEEEGLLDEMSFDEYVRANSEGIKREVDPELISMVSLASGIAEEDIQIIDIEQPVFIPKVVEIREWTDYLQIILAVLIVALLVFVVFKGIGPVEVTELEPELSVEQLLATTKENQTINDIDFNEVSEVRRMIEKFVDEKPDAVAQLLRNWLNEDWD
ncbi:MAG: flagellar M-ring protein FliF C-terminal domain-containing protein [Herbinix sp.]|nr:flagellar M-ring protein FliF C-terminal domain-containing protein [Herbinix sp.]